MIFIFLCYVVSFYNICNLFVTLCYFYNIYNLFMLCYFLIFVIFLLHCVIFVVYLIFYVMLCYFYDICNLFLCFVTLCFVVLCCYQWRLNINPRSKTLRYRIRNIVCSQFPEVSAELKKKSRRNSMTCTLLQIILGQTTKRMTWLGRIAYVGAILNVQSALHWKLKIKRPHSIRRCNFWSVLVDSIVIHVHVSWNRISDWRTAVSSAILETPEDDRCWLKRVVLIDQWCRRDFSYYKRLKVLKATWTETITTNRNV